MGRGLEQQRPEVPSQTRQHVVDDVVICADSGGLRMDCRACGAVDIGLLDEAELNAHVVRFLAVHTPRCQRSAA